MTNDETRKLCLALLKADTQDEVIQLLTQAGFWDNRSAWRYYGDRENNYNTGGNQQDNPAAALVEKLINSVDARLMNECLVARIDPTGPDAPRTMQQAVARFFDSSGNPERESAGRLEEWTDARRTEVARGLTLTATGAGARSGNPCLTITDCGEGQTPEQMPHTLLSLDKKNKYRIHFVQGKFNMGGTGALKFCGQHRLQLILTRRNPAILQGKLTHPTDTQWGFTVVRREEPEENGRSSVYTYLAPLGAPEKPREGGVLCFMADTLPLFPEGREPYARATAWGTLIKLYEYGPSRSYSNTHILLPSGLLSRLDLHLPDLALPIRLHECREEYNKGKSGSFETTLTGLRVRLADNKAKSLEEGFPTTSPLRVNNHSMTATIYAFKKGVAADYRKREGIIFTFNGQTQGNLSKEFFTRERSGRLDYIRDSILVVVDCSQFNLNAYEELFMNSRDRLSDGDFRAAIERELETLLRDHAGLRALRERRRREELSSKLDNAKPIQDILRGLIKQSPTLAALFLEGQQLSNPFRSVLAPITSGPFQGKRYPTYFKFDGKDYGSMLQRDCPLNQRFRIVFETDAVSEYFDRRIHRGSFALYQLQDGEQVPVESYAGPNLHNGRASLTAQLPEGAQAGESLHFVAMVIDHSRATPFQNEFVVRVLAPTDKAPTGPKVNGKRPVVTPHNGHSRQVPVGLAMPNIIEVYEEEWASKDPPFDSQTALRIVPSEQTTEAGDAQEVYDFYVNMDNLYLKTEFKGGSLTPEIVKARWKYGLVLLGLAMVHRDVEDRKARTAGHSVEEESEIGGSLRDRVEYFTRAAAPVLLPMINSLAELEIETVEAAVAD